MKILITGGAGFIGSHIAESLVENGHHVTVYDNFSTGNEGNLHHLGNAITVIRGDILDFAKLKRAFRNQDAISHHAAQLEIMRAHEDPRKDLETNAVGTLNVLRASHHVGIKRLIIASSACVYGQPRYLPQDENHPTDPNWSYGAAKLAAEKYAQIYAETERLDITLLRYGIVFGPREWFRRAMTIFIKRVANDMPPVIFGKGNHFRDFVYIQDAVAFHNLCLRDQRTRNQRYNVASGRRLTMKALAEKIIKVLGKNLKPIYEEVEEGERSKLIQGKTRNLNDLKGMWLDIKKAQSLGWKPKVSLEDGIRKTAYWYLQHRFRWRKVVSSD